MCISPDQSIFPFPLQWLVQVWTHVPTKNKPKTSFKVQEKNIYNSTGFEPERLWPKICRNTSWREPFLRMKPVYRKVNLRYGKRSFRDLGPSIIETRDSLIKLLHFFVVCFCFCFFSPLKSNLSAFSVTWNRNHSD